MNAPERLGLPDALATLSICYAPLIDKHRRAIGTRLTMLSARNPDYLPIGHILRQLNSSVATIRRADPVAPLDATFDESLLDWQAPANALLEIPTIALRDPDAAAGAARPPARHPHGAARPTRRSAATGVDSRASNTR